MSTAYDIRQVTRYVLTREGQKAVKIGFSTKSSPTCAYDMSEFPRHDDAVIAAYALIRDLGAQHDSLGLPEDDRPNFTVKKVTRYVLVRRAPTGATDIAEFKRRDLAEQGRDMAEQVVRGMESMGSGLRLSHD
jgi:hypothetical protein